jgi:hypothetical protein
VRGQTLDEFALGQGYRHGAVAPTPFECVGEAAVGELRETFDRQGAACEGARQTF